MDRFLEELRAQRNRIKAHLDWLDRKIAEREQESGTAGPSPTVVEKPHVVKQGGEEADVILERAKAAGPGIDLDRARVGCLVIFLVATGIFVFLLFGLPYLFD